MCDDEFDSRFVNAVFEFKIHRWSFSHSRYRGALFFCGDVNSGAEVVAGDNIVILGALRGLAHAGAKGNEKAIIAAGKIDTVQIRIANIVKEINRGEEPLHKESCVYVQDNSIIID